MESDSLKLREYLIKSFVRGDEVDFFTKSVTYEKGKWMFNFKSFLCTSEFLDVYTNEFIARYKDIYPFQVCGLESSSLPLIGAIVQKMNSMSMPINAFYVRKSRKKNGMLNLIEGEVNNLLIISIDDIINSGTSIIKQYESLATLGKKIDIAFAVISYKDNKYYQEFYHKYKIKVETVFKLSEVREELNIDELEAKEEKPKINKYKIKWMYENPKPNYFYVNPKSFPVVYKNNIYYGRDDGKFVCVNSEGELIWEHSIPYGSMGKMIFSTPIMYEDKVIFGSYDGNLYCLNNITGKVIWINFDCDWIGASPDISIKNNLVYVGAEYGFWAKKGGLIAVDLDTGDLKWVYREMPDYTHGSPLCVDEIEMVFCGSNEGFLYALNNKTGELKWKLKCYGSIKHRPAFSEGVIITADHSGQVTAVNIKGEKLWEYKMYFGSYCVPKILNGKVYVTSFDKHIYCFDLKTGAVLWKDQTSARIFSSPEIIDDSLFVGSNAGILYEYNKDTGKEISEQIFGERITNKIAFDKDINTIYVLDYVGNLYSLGIDVKK